MSRPPPPWANVTVNGRTAQSGDVVNTGSWVTDATTRNTYVVLEHGKPRLFVYEGEEIMERQKAP